MQICGQTWYILHKEPLDVYLIDFFLLKATPDRRQIEIGYLPGEDNYTADSDLYLKEFQSQLLRWPDLGYLLLKL